MKSSPITVTIFSFLLAVAGLLTGYIGLSAAGYLVPAAALFVLAALHWFGRIQRFVAGVLIVNLSSGLLLVLVLAFGAVLGARKLDVSGVALLVNLLTGGPLLGLIAGPLLYVTRHEWFRARQTAVA
ncbi:MAG: hypothetical protein ABL973_11400 [Micropepsaceae bacterium]